MKKNIILAGGIIISLLLAAVYYAGSSQKQVNINSSPRGKIAATIFPLFDIVRNIAGEDIESILIVPPNASPHTFDPSPKNIKELSGSQLVFSVGHGLDDWILNLAQASQVVRIVQVDNEVPLMTSQHPHDDHEEKNSDNTDPHYWLSVSNAKIISRNIKEELSTAYPQFALQFEENLQNYLIELNMLESEIIETTASFSTNEIATFHNAWGYFARDSGLSIITTFEEFPGEEPTALYIRKFQQNIKSTGIKTVFAEPQFNTQPLEAIAKDLEISISILDPIGGDANKDSFIKLMRYNLNQLKNELQ